VSQQATRVRTNILNGRRPTLAATRTTAAAAFIAPAPPPLPLIGPLALSTAALRMALPMRMTLPVRALLRRFFLAAIGRPRMFVPAAMPAARQPFYACNVIGNRGNVCRVHISRLVCCAVDLLKQFLQFGQSLGAGGTCAAFLFFFLPVHFDKRNRVDYFVTDFTAGHSNSFHRAFKRSITAKI
jgi:hypothetical protein